MLESQEFLERERKRLDEQAEQLAKDKERILPKPRHVEPPQTPEPTMRDFRKWQWSILGLLLLFNLGPLFELMTAPPESFRIIVAEQQVTKLEDEATGETSYLVRVDSKELGPYLRNGNNLPLPAWGAVNVVLVAALAYTRYRMWRAPAEA